MLVPKLNNQATKWIRYKRIYLNTLPIYRRKLINSLKIKYFRTPNTKKYLTEKMKY